MRYLIYCVVVIALGVFCYYTFTDVRIKQHTVKKQIPNEHFYK
jgi:hypothetical protein